MSVFVSLPFILIADIQNVVPTLLKTITEITALVVAITTLVASIGALLISLRNGRKTDALKVVVDGRLTELLARTGTSEHAKGMLRGTAEGLAEGRAESVIAREGRSADRSEGYAAAIAEGRDQRDAREEGRIAGVAEGKGVLPKIDEDR